MEGSSSAEISSVDRPHPAQFDYPAAGAILGQGHPGRRAGLAVRGEQLQLPGQVLRTRFTIAQRSYAEIRVSDGCGAAGGFLARAGRGW